MLSLQSCPTLCGPVDCSPPGSSVHGILQTGRLEWGAMPPSRGSAQGRDRAPTSYISCIGRQLLYHQHHLGSPRSTHPKCQISALLFMASIHSHNLQPKAHYNCHFIEEEIEIHRRNVTSCSCTSKAAKLVFKLVQVEFRVLDIYLY